MAPATHSCDSPSSTLTIAEASNEDASVCDIQPEDTNTYYGRNMLATVVPPPTVGATHTKREEPDLAQHSLNIVKEPAFIAAVVLTVLILLGGFVVTKLSNTPRPRKTAKAGMGLGAVPPGGPQQAPSSRTAHLPLSTSRFQASSISEYEPPTAGPDGGTRPSNPSADPHHGYGIPPRITLSKPEEDIRVPMAGGLSAIQEMGEDSEEESISSPQLLKQGSGLQQWSARPRQGSDASHTTEETVTAEGDLFSSGSSISSITTSGCETSSQSDSGGGNDEVYESADEGEPEMVFEVKRGQSQSLELVKGVLVNWPASASSEEQQLKAPTMPVPALIVTQPSSLSLFTIGSSTSNFSVELSQFPLPPLHLEPALFWQKLEDEINSTLALKQRSKANYK